MRYSVKPRDRIFVKRYGFLSFAENLDINLSNKYSQKLLDSATKFTTDAIKTASKRAIKKQQEQPVTWLVTKLLIKLQAFRKSPQCTLIMEYQKNSKFVRQNIKSKI